MTSETSSSGNRIRVIIVDDHAVVRSGLEQLLATTDDIELVGTASNGNEAIERVDELRPDVVLMDLSMPELDGVEATRRISESTSRQPRTGVDLVLRPTPNPRRARRGRRRLSAQTQRPRRHRGRDQSSPRRWLTTRSESGKNTA